MAKKFSEFMLEDFVAKAVNSGVVNFSKSALSDPHVKKIIDIVAKQTGVKKEQIIADIEAEEAKFKELEAKAPILYNTIALNLIEGEAFNLLKKHKIKIDESSKFSVVVFNRLLRYIKVEHEEFFPLRSLISGKSAKPSIVFVPSSTEKKYNDVDTAAATENATFIFNTEFMQQLIDHAHIKGVVPKSKKYVSNGGDVPDDYAYIEFLIIHEFMHYTNSDWHYQRTYKVSGEISNWVGDFRTNYNLVKAGLDQLPIGLFNDHINYDRQKTYKEMIDVVMDEFKKLNKDEQKKVSDKFGEISDEMGEGEPSGEGKDLSEEEIEAKAKETQEKLGNKKEAEKGDADKADRSSQSSSEDKKAESKYGGSGAGQNGSNKVDWTKERPRFNWKEMLANMVKKSGMLQDTTYTKPSRKSITSMDIAKQTGTASVKPGIVTTTDNKIKLCFVIDSSGSMSNAISKVYANLFNLLKSNKAMLDSDFFLIKFSDTHKVYKVNLGKQTYAEVGSTTSKEPANKSGNMGELFKEHFGSSTNLNSGVSSDVHSLAKNGYNVVLVSDSDICSGSNLQTYISMMKSIPQNQFYTLMGSKQDWVDLCTAIKAKPQNATYIDK